VEFEGEPGSDFLQICSGAVVVELVTVVAEEDEVSLVMEGANSAFL